MIKLPRNQNIHCSAQSVVRQNRNHPDPEIRGKPILDENGRKQYQPCEAFAMHGADVCVAHGGNAPQVVASAKKALALATRKVAEVFEDIALDERMPPEIRLKAGKEILDRAGVRAGMDLGVEVPGWQKVLGAMFGEPQEPSTQDDEEPDAPATPATVDAPKPPAAAPRKAARPAAARKAAPPKVKPPAPRMPKVDW